MASWNFPKNIKDIDEKELAQEARQQVAEWVANGYNRNHLVLAANGSVYLDDELVAADAMKEDFV